MSLAVSSVFALFVKSGLNDCSPEEVDEGILELYSACCVLAVYSHVLFMKCCILYTCTACSPEEVAEGILELITNTSCVGATMTITKRRGIGYWRFRDEEPPKAKL